MMCDLIARMAFAPLELSIQYGHIDLWCAGRHFHDAARKGVREYE